MEASDLFIPESEVTSALAGLAPAPKMAKRHLFFLMERLTAARLRDVPGVMRQAVWAFGGLEVRVQIFYDGEGDTYVHNHGHGFVTYGLAGEYEEAVWVVAPVPGSSHFRRVRSPGGHLSEPRPAPGMLAPAAKRRQSPGAHLITPSDLYHAISTRPGPPLATLLLKPRSAYFSLTEVLSERREIFAPSRPILEIPEKDRSSLLEELRRIIGGSLPNFPD